MQRLLNTRVFLKRCRRFALTLENQTISAICAAGGIIYKSPVFPRFDCLSMRIVFPVGYKHTLEPLEDLATSLKDENLTVDLIAKEKELKNLLGLSFTALSEYDTKTEEMTQRIRESKNKKVTLLAA